MKLTWIITWIFPLKFRLKCETQREKKKIYTEKHLNSLHHLSRGDEHVLFYGTFLFSLFICTSSSYNIEFTQLLILLLLLWILLIVVVHVCCCCRQYIIVYRYRLKINEVEILKSPNDVHTRVFSHHYYYYYRVEEQIVWKNLLLIMKRNCQFNFEYKHMYMYVYQQYLIFCIRFCNPIMCIKKNK